MSFLIVDQYASEYREPLAAAFPGETFVAAEDMAGVATNMAAVRGLIAFGPSYDDAFIQRLPALKWLQFLSSGTDTLRKLPSLAADVLITSCHGMHGPAVSEMAIVHMLTLSHDVRRIMKDQAAGRWNRVAQPLLLNKTVTILGTGVIATELARRCKVMGMQVYGVSGTPRDIPGLDRVFAQADFKQAAALADFLVLLAPLSEKTRGIVNADILRAMKPTAILVNVARGEVCDDEALIAALRNGTIAAAGLDAFKVEPLPSDHPYWTMDNVLVTPHIAGQSDVYAEMALPIITHNLKAFLLGRPDDMRNRVARV